MKKHEIKVGGCYQMKVSGKVVPVKVENIREVTDYKGRSKTIYECTNTTTGRTCRAISAQKFRSEARQPSPRGAGDRPGG